MKKNLLWFFGLLLVAGTFSLSSCNEDLCKDVDCGANGQCFEGTCVCDQGFEGTNCETEWSAKFVGNWNATDVCTTVGIPGSTTYTYISTVTRVSASKIQVSNFGAFDLASKVDFELTESGKFNVTGTDNGARIFSGNRGARSP